MSKRFNSYQLYYVAGKLFKNRDLDGEIVNEWPAIICSKYKNSDYAIDITWNRFFPLLSLAYIKDYRIISKLPYSL